MTNPTPAQTPEPVCREARGCDQVVLCQPGCGARDLLAEATSPPPAAARLTAEAALDVVEAAFGDTLTPDARETALAGLAGLLAVPEATDRAGLRETIAQTLRPHASLGGAPPQWMLPLVDGSNPRAPRITGWRPLDAAADAVLAVVLPLAPTRTDPAAGLDRIRTTIGRLVAHSVGFQDVLDDSDRDPWAKTVGADIAELRRLVDEAPLSPYYEHPKCGFHWHGRDGMDIPVQDDGQPVCPRCELAKVQKKLDYTQRRRDEVGVECKRRGKRVLEQSERIIALERQLDEVRTQLGEEILRTGQAEAELRRLADEAQPTTVPVHLGGHANAERCPACRAERSGLPYPWLCPAEPGTPAHAPKRPPMDPVHILGIDAQPAAPDPVHAIPEPGSNGISACCRRPPHEFVGERVTRNPDEVTCTGPAAEQPAPLRGELKPWQLLSGQPAEPLPQTEQVRGGRRLGPAAGEQQDGARPRCPHCQMPHDLTPGSLPARACAAVRQRIADAARLHTEGEHRLCTPSDCDTTAHARRDGARP